MCVANVSVLKVTWNTIGMLTLKLETLHAINAHRNSNRPIFCEHIETPCIQMCLNMNAKNVAANSNEIITWWYDIHNNIMINVWFFYYNLLSTLLFCSFLLSKTGSQTNTQQRAAKATQKENGKRIIVTKLWSCWNDKKWRDWHWRRARGRNIRNRIHSRINCSTYVLIDDGWCQW